MNDDKELYRLNLKYPSSKNISQFSLQECSPYAAHLYDAEDANTPMRMLPGLCGDYCTDYWNQCRYTLSLLLEDLGVLQQFGNLTAALEEDRKRFCDFLELKDKQYCYPNVLTDAGVYTQAAQACTQMNRHQSKEELTPQKSLLLALHT